MVNNRSNSLFAFVVGGVIGAGIALLYAPSTGAEARRKVREGMDDAGDWVKDKYTDAVDSVTDGAGKVKQVIVDKKDDVKEAYQAGREAYHRGKERLFRETA